MVPVRQARHQKLVTRKPRLVELESAHLYQVEQMQLQLAYTRDALTATRQKRLALPRRPQQRADVRER